MAKAGPNLDSLSSIKADGSRNFIHPADVKGRFVTWRRVVYAILIAIYVLLPFIHIGGKPAVFLDIEGRRFFLFGATFNAQDAWLVFFLITAVGFSLLFLTAWLGRVWCGWACPQTVFLEGVYRRIERWIEGPSFARIKRNAGPMTGDKLLRKTAKHAAFIVVSLLLAHVFISFFVSLRSLFEMMRSDPREHWVAFLWVMVVAGALYFNFAWFREQLCIVICPYGRLQSAMQDKHSLVIGYDVARGEPRGKRSRKVSLPQVTEAQLAAPTQGDCVDCMRCVQVCPTGIDIRNGLQLECIGCAQCIDACDEVMIKIGRPQGLIRYDSLAGLAGEEKKTLRPRLLAYGLALCAAVGGLLFGTIGRTPFEANLLRVRGTPYVLEGGNVRNQYELHVINKNPRESTFHVQVEIPDGGTLTLPTDTLQLESLQSYRLPIFVTLPEASWEGPFDLRVSVSDDRSHQKKDVAARFLGPTPKRRHGS